MYRKIVVGYRHDAHGAEALALARALAEPVSARVVVVTVVDAHGTWGLDTSEGEQAERDAAERVEEAIHGWPPSSPVTSRLVRSASAAASLHMVAAEEQADLLVLGPTHMGRLARAFARTTPEHVIHGAPCAVVVAPRGYEPPLAGIRSIGVAFDASEQARAALAWAAGVASLLEASLRVIAVIEPPPPSVEPGLSIVMPIHYPTELLELRKDALRKDVEDALAGMDYALPVEVALPIGEPAHELRGRASEGIDLLVVGSRDQGPIERVLAGSLSVSLAGNCPAPLAIVPRTAMQARERANPGARQAVVSTGDHELSPREVAQLLSRRAAQLVDVRDDHQRAIRIPHARHIPLAELAAEAVTFDRERPVVFFSGGVERAALAMHACRAAGMNAFVMRGGIRAWMANELPVESRQAA